HPSGEPASPDVGDANSLTARPPERPGGHVRVGLRPRRPPSGPTFPTLAHSLTPFVLRPVVAAKAAGGRVVAVSRAGAAADGAPSCGAAAVRRRRLPARALGHRGADRPAGPAPHLAPGGRIRRGLQHARGPRPLGRRSREDPPRCGGPNAKLTCRLT